MSVVQRNLQGVADQLQGPLDRCDKQSGMSCI